MGLGLEAGEAVLFCPLVVFGGGGGALLVATTGVVEGVTTMGSREGGGCLTEGAAATGAGIGPVAMSGGGDEVMGCRGSRSGTSRGMGSLLMGFSS